jgi:hypothetical protein
MTLNDLKQDVYFLTNSSSATYLDDDLLRNLNRHYDDVVTLIWDSVGDWSFDDSNKTDLPIATCNLVDQQQQYSLPTSARKIERVEVEDDEGNWVLLKPIDKSQITVALDEYKSTPGVPQEYNLIGENIFLYPPPDKNEVTLTNGLKIYISRSVTPLSASGDSPGFASEFHRILSLGAAQDFCIANELSSKEADLRREKERLMMQLKTFYAQRHRNVGNRMFPHREFYQ